MFIITKTLCVCVVKPLCWLMCCPQKWRCILYIHWVLCGREFLLGSLYLCGHNLIMMREYSIIRQHNSEGCSESSSQSRWRTISQKWRRGAVKRRCAICAIRMFSTGKNGPGSNYRQQMVRNTNINEFGAWKNFEVKLSNDLNWQSMFLSAWSV